MTELRIALTAITQTIMAGRVDKTGKSFKGNPVDVTSDCIKAICEKFAGKGTQVVRRGGEPAYEITIVELTQQETKRRQMINDLDSGDHGY